MTTTALAAIVQPQLTATSAAAIELLPRPDLDPYERLAVAFLAEYGINSARSYRADLRAWGTWAVTVASVHPLDARRHHLAAWVRVMTQQPNARTGKPMAPASVARRLSCLAKFYDYGIEVGALSLSPVPHVRRPKVSEESTSVGLAREELVRLLDEAERHSPRFGALVHLHAFNGLRITEALNADVDDLTHDRGHRVLRITRKGGKAATVPLALPTVRTIDTYVGDRRGGPIFLDRSGTSRLAYETAYKQLRRLAKAAGIAAANEISPHSLRHTYATEALDAGAALQHVQDAMGHADPRTTRRYDRTRKNHDNHATFKLVGHLRRAAVTSDGESSAPT